MYTDIFIPKDRIETLNRGCSFSAYIGFQADSPSGKVIKVLGKPGEHDTEIHAI
jgi:ribonuclease R